MKKIITELLSFFGLVLVYGFGLWFWFMVLVYGFGLWFWFML